MNYAITMNGKEIMKSDCILDLQDQLKEYLKFKKSDTLMEVE